VGVIINEFEMIVEEEAERPTTPGTTPVPEQPAPQYKPMDIHAILIHEFQRELRVMAH